MKKLCPCGVQFEAARAHAKYCSATCRQAAYVKRGGKTVQTGLTAEDIRDWYHEMAAAHHPDKGGHLEVMKMLNLGRDLLLKKLMRHHA